MWFLTSETVLELRKPDWSRYQFVVLRLETMSGLKPRGGSSSCRSLLPQMVPLSRSWSGKWWARFSLALSPRATVTCGSDIPRRAR
ncbi:hypothetical protein F2Q70_00027171 [Brassica cretica]|uniref:Uncharacterized protein n=1 Tax=Brassica cretica TaxID=69181 RepID=A0A8S9LJR9_BRACR|nr:hypothetical protein F2Q70_00027171 [Brassica cretica]